MSKKVSDQFLSPFGIDLKSALRNLQSAIMTGAMLIAPCSSVEAQQANENLPDSVSIGARASS